MIRHGAGDMAMARKGGKSGCSSEAKSRWLPERSTANSAGAPRAGLRPGNRWETCPLILSVSNCTVTASGWSRFKAQTTQPPHCIEIHGTTSTRPSPSRQGLPGELHWSRGTRAERRRRRQRSTHRRVCGTKRTFSCHSPLQIHLKRRLGYREQ